MYGVTACRIDVDTETVLEGIISDEDMPRALIYRANRSSHPVDCTWVFHGPPLYKVCLAQTFDLEYCHKVFGSTLCSFITARHVCISRTMLWQDVCPSPYPCLSVRLSKRLYISSKFFHHRVAHHSSFCTPNGMAILRRGPS